MESGSTSHLFGLRTSDHDSFCRRRDRSRANAAQYVVNRGLVVAMRSSIYCGLNFVGDVTEAIPLAQAAAAGASGDIALAKAKFVNHSCQMP